MSKPDLSDPKDFAYWERNQLVAALSKIYPSWLERHPESDTEWEDDWRWIVFIEIPTRELENKYVQGGFMMNHKRQLSWHIHDSEKDNFWHLKERRGNSWDGHTTEEKYRRLSNLRVKQHRIKSFLKSAVLKREDSKEIWIKKDDLPALLDAMDSEAGEV